MTGTTFRPDNPVAPPAPESPPVPSVRASSRPMRTMVVFEERSRIALWTRELPPPGPGQVSVRILKTLISPGSECRALEQSYDAPHWARWAKFPFYPGYSAVGVVEESGPGAGLNVGQRVIAPCSHASMATIPAYACLPVDGDLPVEAQVWFALAKIAAMALQVMPPPVGRHVALVGDGPLAQMAVRWLHCCGAQRITVIGRHEQRLEHAMRGGASEVRLYRDPPARLRSPGEPPLDVVIDATGRESGFLAAQALVRRGGTVVLLGDPGYPGELRIHPRFVPDGLRLIGAHDGLETDGWDAAGIIRTFLRLVRGGGFDLHGLVTHAFPPEEAALAYEACADKSRSMGVVFDWEKPGTLPERC